MQQTPVDLPRCSSRQGLPGRMPVPDVRWLHRDTGKDLWIFSSCSNAHSSDCPTAAKSGGKIRITCYIRRKGRKFSTLHLLLVDLLVTYKCLPLCGLFFFKGFCKSLFQIGFDFSQIVSRPLHCEAENLLLFRVSEITGIVFERFLATVYKGNIIKNLIMDCQSYTKYRPNETTGGIFVSWRRKEELPTGA